MPYLYLFSLLIANSKSRPVMRTLFLKAFDIAMIHLLFSPKKVLLKKGRVMKKCLKITLMTLDSAFRDVVQGAARKLDLEGTVQFVDPKEIVIIACGSKENIDAFLDNLHQGFGSTVPEEVQVEPFLKEKDYRGIFRVLE